MFEDFGFDPKTLSDDELFNREVDLQAKLVFASRFASSGAVANLQLLLQSISAERYERMARAMIEERERVQPKVIESDPTLAEQRPANQPEKGKITPQNKPRVQITRSDRPVADRDPTEDK